MADRTGADAFLNAVPTFASFAQIADPSAYGPLPDDWVLGLADVVASSRAIEAGRYKAVNMAGAAVISAVSNALGHGDFPFVFGGDGASFAVPPGDAATARAALAATATFAQEELGLDLRVACVPVREIREAGLDVRVARFAASPQVAYAMFSGGGLAWAEERLKAGEFAVAAAAPGTRPDLAGLSCRFDEIPARHGTVLSLIARPGPSGDAAAYRALIEDLLRRVEARPDAAAPVPPGGPPLGWPPPGLDLEARAGHRPGGSRLVGRLLLLGRTAFSFLVLRFRIPVGRFDPTRYLADLVANTDYRKYDDGLRLTIDCAPAFADAVEAQLRDAADRGEVIYGLHRQAAALMTCFTPSPYRRDHIHFVDGAAGGYAAAANGLKTASAS